MSSTETTIELIESLSEQCREVETQSELDQTVVSFVSHQFDADLALIAQKENGQFQPSATVPPDWTDADDLLSPVSLPANAVSRGDSCLVDDCSDVRCAATTESIEDPPSVEYRSIMVTPLGDESMLLVGSRTPDAFADPDLEGLRAISTFAAAMRAQIVRVETKSQERIMEAAAGVLSHDAGNFLSIIQGHLELAREDPTEEHFEAIERGTQRLEELIDSTSRILRTGEQVTDVEPVELHEVVHTAWEAVGTEQANLITGRLGSIEADRSSLCEIFENVFRNSVEHVGPDVTVWVGLLDGDDGFYVEDSGPAPETEELDSLFEAGATAQKDNEGLGLAIVKRIAEAHGWNVSATIGEMGGFRLEFTNVNCLE